MGGVERPVLFAGAMVQAILAGRKSQTRRVVKGNPVNVIAFIGKDDKPTFEYGFCETHERFINKHIECPFGKPGDRLWVRETHGFFKAITRIRVGDEDKIVKSSEQDRVIYRADGGWALAGNIRDTLQGGKWKPSIFMKRKHSRILLEVTAVRVERLNDISEDDAKAEGAGYHNGGPVGNSGYRHDPEDGIVFSNAKASFSHLWERINGGGSWAENPWVWVVSFERVKP